MESKRKSSNVSDDDFRVEKVNTSRNNIRYWEINSIKKKSRDRRKNKIAFR
jgi:hypothetical protein